MINMKLKKSQLFSLIIVVFALFIHLYSNNVTRVENQYATGIYAVFSRFFRYLFGWIPFSIGDILYAFIILWLLWKLVKLITKSPSPTLKTGSVDSKEAKISKLITMQIFVHNLLKPVQIFLILYIVFNALWGINYNRIGLAHQLHLQIEEYNLTDLKMINSLLVKKTNEAKLAIENITYPSNSQLFSKVKAAYQHAEIVYPFLKYTPVSLKPSLWSWVGNYMGFTGYYNPFTGEAQVNTLVPKFLQPFTSCHEVAHQLGFAKEMEANAAAYLVASISKDTLLHYSLYLDMFMYSNRNLFEIDSISAKEFRKQLNPQVKADLIEWKIFNKKYKSSIEPFFRWVYEIYLEQNKQPEGILSYDEVTGFIIAWYKKYGKI